jgi:hypothetical protein
MIHCGYFHCVRTRKIPQKLDDQAKILLPLMVIDTSNNTKVGEYHTKQEILAAVEKYKQQRKSRAKILVMHYPSYYNYTDYFAGVK